MYRVVTIYETENELDAQERSSLLRHMFREQEIPDDGDTTVTIWKLEPTTGHVPNPGQYTPCIHSRSQLAVVCHCSHTECCDIGYAQHIIDSQDDTQTHARV